MIALLATALVCRVLFGTRESSEHRSGLRAPALFWGLFAVGASAFYLVTTEKARAYQAGVARMYAIDWASAALSVVESPVLWFLGGILICALLEVGFLALRRRVSSTWPQRVLSWVAYAAAAALLVEVAASLFLSLPTLEVIEARARPTAIQYAREVLTVVGTSFRLDRPDHLLVESFWVGFGWVDTLPSPILPAALMAASGLALVVLLFSLARANDGRRLAILAILGIGLAGALGIYAVSSLAMIRNVYGRYLVGWYLVALGLAWSVAVLLPPATRLARIGVPRTVWLLAACGGVHAYCVTVILRRYF